MESGEYRNQLAHKIREQSDREQRESALHAAKNSPDYVAAHNDHSQERTQFMRERELEKAVEEVNTFAEMKDVFQKKYFFVGNPVAGMDHSEHLLKRLDMADTLSYAPLMPAGSGLRTKVESFLDREGRRADTLDTTKYREYVGNRLADHELSSGELAQACQKVPAETFGSLDTGLEAAVMLLNTLPGTRTLHSCAGHIDYAAEGINDTSLTEAYVRFSTTDENLIQALRSLPYPVQATNPNEYMIRFWKGEPPEEWIGGHGLRSRQQLFEGSKKAIAPMLGEEVLGYNVRSFTDNLPRLQEKYIREHPEAANMPYARNGRYLRAIDDSLLEVIEAREYQGYYLSAEAEAKREDFLKAVTSAIDNYRRSRTSSEGPKG